MKLAPLNTIFKIEYGNKLDLKQMEQTDLNADAPVAFIGRSGERNGVVAYVEPLPTVSPYPAGFITVALGGTALASFVQPRQFYTAQNIAVLEPITEMTLETKMYYCLCIEANRFRYSTFGREANRTLKHLLVPTTESIPAWVGFSATAAIEQLKTDLSSIKFS